MDKIRVKMSLDTFSIIFLEYHIKKHEYFLKFIFHGFATHLKDDVSARYFSNSLAVTFVVGSIVLLNSRWW